jgi:hypothetical protein
VKRLGVSLAALALGVAACGGGSDEGSQEAKTVIQEAAQERAGAIVLTLADFPSGWRAEADSDEEEPECVGFDFSDLTVNGRGESPNFLRGEATLASSIAAVFATEEQAKAAFGRLANQKLADCFTDFIREQSDENVRVLDATSGELSFPSMGDRSAAYQIALELETEGFTPSAFVDLIFIQDERAVAVLFFLDVLTPFPDEEKETLARKVADRMGPAT